MHRHPVGVGVFMHEHNPEAVTSYIRKYRSWQGHWLMIRAGSGHKRAPADHDLTEHLVGDFLIYCLCGSGYLSPIAH